ncbi:prevent-host-death protein [Chryseobacterium sp.]|uniref:prevent-host-death protein n=1 Tax=Chryseobacterium sp. TaxID=1871047 RepID=UPI0028997E2A|nr:prevent-host-death protein [Chryseobacterium sp.]
MQYSLELRSKDSTPTLTFNNIYFDAFKINVIEIYKVAGKRKNLTKLIFKVRTLDNILIDTKTGNGRVILKDEKFEEYKKLSQDLNSYEFRNKLIDTGAVKQAYVDFLLMQLIMNYQIGG